MKVQKIDGAKVETLQRLSAAREKKNEGTREEKNIRKVVEAEIPETNQKNEEFSFMFNGKPVATWTKGQRFDIDRVKLQTEFPEVYAKVYVQGETWKLDVL